jgi:hypothetical protein
LDPREMIMEDEKDFTMRNFIVSTIHLINLEDYNEQGM